MRKFIKIILFSVTVTLLCISLAACGDTTDYEDDGQITLETKQLYLPVGEQYIIVAKYLDKGAKVKWSTDKPLVAKVDENGVVKTLGVGESIIKATLPNGNTAVCKLTVGDALVNGAFETDPIKKRYKTIQEAADAGGDIIVFNGVYPEYVTAVKPCKIIGVGSVVMNGIAGTSLDIEGVDFLTSEPLPPNNATVTASDALKMKNCSITVSVTVEKPKELTGGYGIYCGPNAQLVSVTKTVINNYRIGIYLYKTSASIDINDVSLSNCKTGISVDVKGNDKTLENYNAKGKIDGNLYKNCYKPTEFQYFGTGYRGDLDFKDHTDSGNQPESDENQEQ